MPLV
jgi:hypothetical protein